MRARGCRRRLWGHAPRAGARPAERARNDTGTDIDVHSDLHPQEREGAVGSDSHHRTLAIDAFDPDQGDLGIQRDDWATQDRSRPQLHEEGRDPRALPLPIATATPLMDPS